MRSSPGNGVLLAAVEEERDVRVLLGLGDAQLPQARVGQHLAQHVCRTARAGRATGSRERRVVLRHADVVDAAAMRAASKPSKSGSTSARVISRARSGRKLKKMTASPSSTRARRPAPIDRRQHELVGLACGVAPLDRRAPASRRRTPSPCDDGVVAALTRVPALVAVHRVVAAHDRGDAAQPSRVQALADLGQIARAAAGGVSRPSRKAVHEHVAARARAGQSQQRRRGGRCGCARRRRRPGP